MLELINEYFYGLRIFPGQDPAMVYVGWVTTQYHLHSNDFSQDCVRNITVQKLDNYGGIAESVDRQSCYLMRVDEMYHEVTNDPSGKPPARAHSPARGPPPPSRKRSRSRRQGI